MADIFSATIREYSAGEHLPCAIIVPRRLVSHEASARSTIISGKGAGFLRRRVLMSAT